LVVFQNGAEVRRHVGACAKAKLDALIGS
jgi:hypothetical protein